MNTIIIIIFLFFGGGGLAYLSLEQCISYLNKPGQKKNWGATFHIPLTKFATFNRLLHCSIYGNFQGLFVYFRGLFFAFRGEITRRPPCIFPLLITHNPLNCIMRTSGRQINLWTMVITHSSSPRNPQAMSNNTSYRNAGRQIYAATLAMSSVCWSIGMPCSRGVRQIRCGSFLGSYGTKWQKIF